MELRSLTCDQPGAARIVAKVHLVSLKQSETTKRAGLAEDVPTETDYAGIHLKAQIYVLLRRTYGRYFSVSAHGRSTTFAKGSLPSLMKQAVTEEQCERGIGRTSISSADHGQDFMHNPRGWKIGGN